MHTRNMKIQVKVWAAFIITFITFTIHCVHDSHHHRLHYFHQFSPFILYTALLKKIHLFFYSASLDTCHTRGFQTETYRSHSCHPPPPPPSPLTSSGAQPPLMNRIARRVYRTVVGKNKRYRVASRCPHTYRKECTVQGGDNTHTPQHTRSTPRFVKKKKAPYFGDSDRNTYKIAGFDCGNEQHLSGHETPPAPSPHFEAVGLLNWYVLKLTTLPPPGRALRW